MHHATRTPTSPRSLWADTMPDDEIARPSARSDDDVDVVVVGAGLTGLWTAWYLRAADPGLRISVLERERVGFGASGRNGGWCSALLPMSLDRIAARHGAAAARRFQAAMHDTVIEVERFAGNDIAHRGGTIAVARTPAQVARLRHEVERYRSFGFGEDDYRWLDADEATDHCAMSDTLGAMFTPHCATAHPLRLTHAVARAALEAGVDIREGVDVNELHPGRVVTSHGTVRAEVIVRATEGYTSELPGARRESIPIYSMMVATEPLPADVWNQIGLSDRPTFADGRHLIIYGQRTADGRIAFGGRGAPYHFGSRVDPSYDTDDRIRTRLTDTLRELFPAIGDAAVTHHWGGPLGAHRDWNCSVRYDRLTGLASAGGYVGDGVATTNLAGRTLAALITGAGDRELPALPWVGHRSRRWEFEPLRWIGVNAARTAARLADRSEADGRRSSRWGSAVDVLLRR